MFYFKENTQFLFLCNPQKSGASKVCITIPQITQKDLTKYTFHCLELNTEILSFLQIFNVREITTQLSNFLQENQQERLYFWHILGL